AIMRLLEASEFEVCRTLKSLVDVGLVEIEMPSALDSTDSDAEAPPVRKTRARKDPAPELNVDDDAPIDAARELHELADAEVAASTAGDGDGEQDENDPEFKEALVKFLSSVRDA